MAMLRAVRLDLPFHADYLTQRVLIASNDLGVLLLQHYDDDRHPPLFYLLLHAWEWGGLGEGWMRLPAVLFSLATAAMLVFLARPHVGTARAVAAAALLGLSAPFLIQSRDVSDLPLFLFLVLLSSHLLLRGLAAPTPARIVGYAVAATAMVYAYYLAGVVLAIHAAVLVASWRRPSTRRVSLALAAVLVLGSPSWVVLAGLIRQDRVIRAAARAYPDNLWGEQTAEQYLADVGDHLLPSTGPWAVLPILALLGIVRWGLARGVSRDALILLTGLVVSGLALALAGVEHVRLAPHYLMYLLPPLLILAVVGAVGPPDEFGGNERAARYRPGMTAAGVAVLAAVAALLAWEMVRRAPDVWSPAERGEYRAAAQVIRDGGGPDLVVGDSDQLHTILLYYAFEDPVAAYHTCERDPLGNHLTCVAEDGELLLLTPMGRLTGGWEQRSLERFRRVRRAAPLWYVDLESFPNAALQEEVRHSCDLRFRDGKLALYRCEPAGASATPLQR